MMLELSPKGKSLVDMYTQMANCGYDRHDGKRVETAFSDFESRKIKEHIKKIFNKHSVASILDYGCGGSDWYAPGFDSATGMSAVDYYQIECALRYEPARSLDDRAVNAADCVISFDVLEHVFISDVPKVIEDMFINARAILILNVACYPASARLPNGENAHITVRPPIWWKGQVDSIASRHPDITVYLGCSQSYGQIGFFSPFGETIWQQSASFETAC